MTLRKGPKLVHVTTVPQTLRFLTGQVSFMARNGFEVSAVSSPGAMLDQFGETEGVSVFRVPMFRRITPLRDLVALWRICVLLLRMRPDVVHTHTPKGSLLGILAAWLVRVPVRIYHLHGLPLSTARGLKRFVLMMAERLTCALATDILCVSESLKVASANLGVCPASKIIVLGSGSVNGVDAVGRFDPNRYPLDQRVATRASVGIRPDELVVGYVGRIVADKGWLELASAWRQIRRDFPEAHLLVVGPFETEDPVPQAVKEQLENDERVSLVGQVDDVVPYLATMDLLVLPSYREGFGNVLLEGAAMELPVIATAIVGCVDAVADGRTGTLIPPHDTRALIEAIARYLTDAELRLAHGQAGRKRALESFNPIDICQALRDHYIKRLQERGAKVVLQVLQRMGDNAR